MLFLAAPILRRAPIAPAFLDVTFYGHPDHLALIRKRLYLALQARHTTVAEVRYSATDVQASTAVRLRCDEGDTTSLIDCVAELCRELKINDLRVARAGDSAENGPRASGEDAVGSTRPGR